MLSGYSTPAVPVLDEQLGTSQRVMPEVVSQVQLSSSDINRIVCPVDIKDIVFSKEKGITVKLSGSNAFVKFLVMKREGRDHYSSIPTEIFIVCGDDIYNVVAIPKRIPSQTIQLAPGRMDALKKNMSAYGEMPLEKKIVTIIKQIYTDNIPDSITVQKVNKPYDIFQNVNVVHYKTFTVDGEGLRVKEFRATSEESREIYLREKDLIRHDLVRRPVAISIDVLNLKKGEMSRIFMVERTVDE